MNLDAYDLPASVKPKVALVPYEDLVLTILRKKHPDMDFDSLISYDMRDFKYAFVNVRRYPGDGYWSGRQRLLDDGSVLIEVFTKNPDGDAKGALISEALVNTIIEAGHEHEYYPGLGSIVKAELIEEPIRKTDWVTATGPVQFADLPTGTWRYETRIALKVRPPLWG